ncbi:thiamine biosynthesis protein ThiF [Rhodobacterales bacterium]|nr:thiamine biosynthesis protein ThiF [Rhodobacterales bacterium]
MDKTKAIQIIDATLRARGFEYIGSGSCDYQGSVSVHGNKVDIKLFIPDVQFASKAKAYLVDREQIPLETLAHIETEYGICYASGAGLPLDFYEPGQAVLRILAEIERTLELSYKGRARQEVVDEYQFYWDADLGIRIFLPKSLGFGIYKAWSFFACVDGQPLFLGIHDKKKLRRYITKHTSPAQIWYLPQNIGPANSIKIPSTLAELETWLSGQPLTSSMTWVKAEKLLIERGTLVIAAPNAVVGFDLEIPKILTTAVQRGGIRKVKLPEIVRGKKHEINLNRYSGTWCSMEDIASRNYLDSASLQNTSIALVGCGTIGSHLARMLVQSGAGTNGKLTLFDNQLLSAGNIGRHLLGFSAVGEKKATALKKELERFHPQVNVHAVADDALAKWDMLQKHDLIIDATGEWNVQSALNDNFLNNQGGKLKGILHSWIFMNGAAVQSFLNLNDEFACFRCLKPKFDGPWRYPAGHEHDELNLQPASCGEGSYVPFSVDASTMAASLANRAVLDWAEGKPGKRLRTVIVDIDRGRGQKPVSPKPSVHCPACGSKREAN